MDDQADDAKRLAAYQFIGESLDALLAERFIRRGEVDQVRCVGDDRCQTRGLLRLLVLTPTRTPSAKALCSPPAMDMCAPKRCTVLRGAALRGDDFVILRLVLFALFFIMILLFILLVLRCARRAAVSNQAEMMSTMRMMMGKRIMSKITSRNRNCRPHGHAIP
jgi:hypothetical protein